MNDRMYELINQCFIGTTDGKFSPLNTVANVEKFAELLVRECAEIAATVVVEREGVEFGLVEACYKHFGVDVETRNVTNCEQQAHTCPYLEEIHGDYTTLCDCTPEQEHECARDI